MSESAGEVDHDNGLVRAAQTGLLLSTQQRGQTEATEGESADLQEGAARHAIAELAAGTEERQHEEGSPGEGTGGMLSVG